jgi:hypothetical protein
VSAQLTPSPPFLLPDAASPMTNVVTPPHRVTFSFHGVKTSSVPPLHLSAMLHPVATASSSGNVSSRWLPSRAKIKALNPHHRRRHLSLDCPTFILHCYKNVISTLTTLSNTQLCRYFDSSLARAACHQSSTCRRHSLFTTVSCPLSLYTITFTVTN